MIHDTVRGGEDDVTELARREKVVDPLLEVSQGDVESGGDDSALVDTANQVDNDLATTVVIDNLELTDVL